MPETSSTRWRIVIG